MPGPRRFAILPKGDLLKTLAGLPDDITDEDLREVLLRFSAPEGTKVVPSPVEDPAGVSGREYKPSDTLYPEGQLPRSLEARKQFPTAIGPGEGKISTEAARSVLGLLGDVTPGLGDVKAVGEAVIDPTLVNIGAAALGAVPVVGDVAGKVGAGIGNKILGRLKNKPLQKKPDYFDSYMAKENPVGFGETFTWSPSDEKAWINRDVFKGLPTRASRHATLRHEDAHGVWNSLDDKLKFEFEADFIDNLPDDTAERWLESRGYDMRSYEPEKLPEEYFSDLWAMAHEPEMWPDFREEALDNPTFHNILESVYGEGAFAKKVYHGTPHTFEPEPRYPMGRFQRGHVGTGEGGGAYGRGEGGYHAENPNVGRTYQPRTLSMTTEVENAIREHDNLGFDTPGQAWNAIKRHDDWMERWDMTPYTPEEEKALKTIQERLTKRPGNLYESALYAVDEEVLVLDKPFKEQSEKVKKAVEAVLEGAGDRGSAMREG